MSRDEHVTEPFYAKVYSELTWSEKWLRMWHEIGMYNFFMKCNGKIPEK